MSEQKREAFDKWALANLGTIPFSPFLTDILIMNHAWQAYQQAYKDMFPVFDRIEEVINKGGSIYEPLFGGCKEHEDWKIFDANKDVIVTGKTFRELCVNLIMSDERMSDENE